MPTVNTKLGGRHRGGVLCSSLAIPRARVPGGRGFCVTDTH